MYVIMAVDIPVIMAEIVPGSLIVDITGIFVVSSDGTVVAISSVDMLLFVMCETFVFFCELKADC